MRRRQGARAAIVTLETALNNQLDSSTTPVGTTKMALVITKSTLGRYPQEI